MLVKLTCDIPEHLERSGVYVTFDMSPQLQQMFVELRCDIPEHLECSGVYVTFDMSPTVATNACQVDM